MQKFKKPILFLFFIFTSLVFQFCDQFNKSGCSILSIDEFRISNPYTIDQNRHINYMTADSIPMNNQDSLYFGIFSEYSTKQVMCLVGNGNLYATSPSLPPDIKQDSLDIITLMDFDAQHPAGSRINELFLLSQFPLDYYYLPEYFPIGRFNEFKNKLNNNYSKSFTLVLLKKPINNKLQIRLAFYDLDNSDSLVTKSPVFTFKH